jgi:hypothetical protein
MDERLNANKEAGGEDVGPDGDQLGVLLEL